MVSWTGVCLPWLDCIDTNQSVQTRTDLYLSFREISRAAGKVVTGMIDEENTGNNSQ